VPDSHMVIFAAGI